MVREIREGVERRYVCEACGFVYRERIWAEKCQKYCGEHGACSLEIISHAVQKN